MDEPLPPPPADDVLPQDVKQWCIFIHLSTYAAYLLPMLGVVMPIVLWQMRRDQHAFIDQQGRETTNAAISYAIYGLILGGCWFMAGLLAVILIGYILMIPLFFLSGIWLIAVILLPILAVLRVGENRHYRYPFIIRFL